MRVACAWPHTLAECRRLPPSFRITEDFFESFSHPLYCACPHQRFIEISVIRSVRQKQWTIAVDYLLSSRITATFWNVASAALYCAGVIEVNLLDLSG